MTPVELAAAAAELARSGLPVFPVAANKAPCTPHGFKNAVSDPEAARVLFMRSPGAKLIGVPTGVITGFVVVDIDPQGKGWFAARVRRFPETLIHGTPRGGFHLFYQCPDPPVRNSAGKLGPGIDIRGEGGSIIFAPSPGYEVIDESDIAPLPQWIIRELNKPKPISTFDEAKRGGSEMALARFVARSRPGERNVRLFWAACRLGEHDLSISDVKAAALATGLDPLEVQQTIKSGYDRGQGHRARP